MIAGYGLARFPWQAMAACFAFNALESAGTIVWTTTKQRLVPEPAARACLELRLVHLDRARADLLRVHRSGRRGVRRPGRRSSAPALLGGAITLAFLFLPGMRDIERSGVLVGTPIDATDDTGFGALEGPLAPISAGQGPFPPREPPGRL